MTCPTCNDRGVTADRRLNRGNAMICPECEAGQDSDPISDFAAVLGILCLAASAILSLLVVSMLNNLDEQFVDAVIARWPW